MIDWAAIAIAGLGVVVLAAALARASLAYAGAGEAGVAQARLGVRWLRAEPGQVVREWALPLLVALGPLFLFAGRWAVAGIAVVALLWGARRVTVGAFLPRTPLDWPIALMMAMLPVSLVVSFDIGFSLARAALMVYGVALYYAFVDRLGARDGRLRAGVYVYLAAGGALAVLGLLGTDWQAKAPLLGDIVRNLPQVAGRLSRDQTGFHPNIVAGALLWVIVPLAALVGARGAVVGRVRWALGALLVLTGGTLLLAQSRGALVGLAAGLGLLAWLAWPRVRPVIAGALAVGAIVLVAAGPAQVSARLLDTAGTTLGPLTETDNLVVRADAWQSALRAISDRPLTGIGMDTFRRLIRTEYRAPSIPDTYDIGHAHNQFLQAALDLGLPGLVGYLALWIVAAALAARSYRAAPDRWTRALAAGIAGALLATFVHGLTDSVALVSKPGVFFWGILALDVGLWSAVRANERAGESLSRSAIRWLRDSAAPAVMRSLPVLVPTVVALGLRLYGFGRLGLSLAEGVTLQAARLPWPEVPGVAAAYAGQPPLYYALAKLAAAVLPEMEAGRLLSVAAGTLAVAAVCALVRRLAGRGAGVIAGLALAVAPVHIWYSQQALPYALAALLVALSYLALAAFRQGQRGAWAAAYGAAVAAALYTDTGAIYALLPQVFVLAWLWREHGRRALPLVWAAMAGAVVYVPWLALRTTGATTTPDTGYGPVEQVIRVLGLGGVGTYVQTDPAPWYAAQWVQAPVIVAAVALAGLGAAALARRSKFALLVVGVLTVGTAAAALLGLLAPGYSESVTLYVLSGWVVLMGAAVALAGALPQAVRAVGAVAGCVLLVMSSGTLAAVYGQTEQEHWPELAAMVSGVRKYGLPVEAYPLGGPAATLLEMHRPGVLSDAGPGTDKGAMWLAHAAQDHAALDAEMASRGYGWAMRREEWPSLYLDLYVKEDISAARAGWSEMLFNGRFEGVGQAAYGWDANEEGARLEPDEGGARRVVLPNEGKGEIIYASAVGAAGEGLYLVQLEGLGRYNSSTGRLYLECVNAAGEWTTIAPGVGGLGVGDTAGAWQKVNLAIECPADTERVRVDLRNLGDGEVAYRNVRLWKMVEP
jgi:hypothetical protein